VRLVLLLILAVIVFLGFWRYQEIQIAKDWAERMQESGALAPATRY
jgi:preprotein translocase subunit SecY